MISALKYNYITLNKTTNFQRYWNSTIIKKPKKAWRSQEFLLFHFLLNREIAFNLNKSQYVMNNIDFIVNLLPTIQYVGSLLPMHLGGHLKIGNPYLFVLYY